MKIKNELITIKIGKKIYEFNNLILNEYLKRFVIAQLDPSQIKSNLIKRQLCYCLLKFDTPFQGLNSNTTLKNTDFDVCILFEAVPSQFINENSVIVQYFFEIDEKSTILDYKKYSTQGVHLRNYYGKKITAIGFNSIWIDDTDLTWKVPVCAVLDTTNYNLYIQKDQGLSITRRDVITTDAEFYSGNKKLIPGPIHLAPFGIPQIINNPTIYNEDKTSYVTPYYNGFAFLHSVGLSSYKDYIDKEFVIGQDIQVYNNENELDFSKIENYLTGKAIIGVGNNIYPSLSLYPTKTTYKYLILKYKVWQVVTSGTYGNITEEIVDTGYYYYMALPLTKIGKFNFKIKYERG